MLPGDRKVSGDQLQLSASDWNRFLRAADIVLGSRGHSGRLSENIPTDRDFIPLKSFVNETADPNPDTPVLVGEVIGIGKPVDEPEKGDKEQEDFLIGNPLFRGETITAEQIQECSFALARETVHDGDSTLAGISGFQFAKVTVKSLDHRYATPIEGERIMETAATGSVQILYPFPDGCQIDDTLIVAVRMSNCAAPPCRLYVVTDNCVRIDDELLEECDLPYIMATPGIWDGTTGPTNPFCAAPDPNASQERVYLPYLIELIALDEPDGMGCYPAECYGIVVGNSFYADIEAQLGVLITKNSLFHQTITYVTDIICQGDGGSGAGFGPVDFYLAKSNIVNGQIARHKESDLPITCGPSARCCCEDRECTATMAGRTLVQEDPPRDPFDCSFSLIEVDCPDCIGCPGDAIKQCNFVIGCRTDVDNPGVSYWFASFTITCQDGPFLSTIASGAEEIAVFCTDDAYSVGGTFDVFELELGSPVGDPVCQITWEVNCTAYDPCEEPSP